MGLSLGYTFQHEDSLRTEDHGHLQKPARSSGCPTTHQRQGERAAGGAGFAGGTGDEDADISGTWKARGHLNEQGGEGWHQREGGVR